MSLNADDRVDGILVQLPLPDGLDSVALLHEIAPDKDADGLHALNLGHLYWERHDYGVARLRGNATVGGYHLDVVAKTRGSGAQYFSG